MSNRTNFYINGEWIAPSTSDTIDVINPATEQSIGQVAMGGAADVDKAVAAAKAAFETFSQTTREERIAILEAVIAKYSERMGDVAAANLKALYVVTPTLAARAWALAARFFFPAAVTSRIAFVPSLRDLQQRVQASALVDVPAFVKDHEDMCV